MEDLVNAPADPSATSASVGQPAVKTAPNKDSDMHIKVYSPFKVYYDGRAKSISALNETGPFDILAGHRNFMTLVSACELLIRDKESGEQKIKIARGIMHVKADEITVFLDI